MVKFLTLRLSHNIATQYIILHLHSPIYLLSKLIPIYINKNAYNLFIYHFFWHQISFIIKQVDFSILNNLFLKTPFIDHGNYNF